MYRLYATQSIEEGQEYTFKSSDKDYYFVYSDKEPSQKSIEIPPEMQIYIGEEAKEWLLDCKIEENKKAMEEHPEYMDLLSAFLDHFEEELKKESGNAEQ